MSYDYVNESDGIGQIRTDISAVQAQCSSWLNYEPIESRWLDLNQRPLGPKPSALRLLSYTPKMALVAGFEPATSCLTDRHSTLELHQKESRKRESNPRLRFMRPPLYATELFRIMSILLLMNRAGIEPATLGLRGRCSA